MTPKAKICHFLECIRLGKIHTQPWDKATWDTWDMLVGLVSPQPHTTNYYQYYEILWEIVMAWED